MKQTKQQTESLAYQKIKANDKILQTLSELEIVLRKLWNPGFHKTPLFLIYKDQEGNEIDMDEFYEQIFHFININERYLTKDSAENFEIIKRVKK